MGGVDVREPQVDTDALEAENGIAIVEEVESPTVRRRVTPVQVTHVLVLKDFDDLFDAFDSLKIPTFAVASTQSAEFGGGDDLEEDPGMFAAADGEVWDTGCVALLCLGGGGAANFALTRRTLGPQGKRHSRREV